MGNNESPPNSHQSWRSACRYDPIRPLLMSEHPAILYCTRRELLGEAVAHPRDALWRLPIPTRILKRQTSGGSWPYPGKTARSATDYDLLETYRQLGFLVEMYGFTREHEAIERTAGYVFSKQASEGDIRGIYGQQYSPNYTAALVELLVKAGYESDGRIARAFAWFESMRQADGGWALPFRTQGRNLDSINQPEALPSDRSKPYSHLITGIVLRAYAAHPAYRRSRIAIGAVELLAERFFQKDVYPDRNRVDDWTRFSFPFWWTDLVSSLDVISLINPELRHDNVAKADAWLLAHQQPDGLFQGHLLKDRYHDLRFWHSFAICRALKRLLERA